MKHIDKLKQIKKDSYILANTASKKKNEALLNISLQLYERRDEIFKANELDIENAKKDNLATPIISRLKFDLPKLETCIEGIKTLICLEDNVGKILMKRELDENLILTKQSVPIGVIGVIFESRPDALIQIATLCLKSGNCSILKGGSEAQHTNKILFEIIHSAGIQKNLPDGFTTLIEHRSQINEILSFDKYIDLIIPRGSNQFVQYIMENSKIPVMGHADGICHTYIHKDADLQLAKKVFIDAKTQYPVACNALETLIVHEAIYEDIKNLLPDTIEVFEGAYGKEYSDYKMGLIKVNNIHEAIDHINTYGSHHTDVIISENAETAEYFMNMVDSAGVYHNCSSRFADGFRYGFGAEVGISTGKLHARGPVGLDGLLTYKYKLRGSGQIVDDYAKGISKFKFEDLM